jgi:hypothetical protein
MDDPLTSVPPFCTRSVSRAMVAASKSIGGAHCESSGRMVMPACPPTTGTATFSYEHTDMRIVSFTTTRSA